MRKEYVNVHDCVEGDILAQDVYTMNRALLVTESTVINEYIKKKLVSVGIDRVAIYVNEPVNEEDEQTKAYRELRQSYGRSVNGIKTIINDIAVGKNLDFDKINEISDLLYNEVNSKNNVIKCLSEVREFDEYTYAHSINVSLYSMLIAKWLKLSQKEIKEAMITGLLHDIGKANIPPEILNKKGFLLPEEYEIMKKHTIYGYNTAKSIPGISGEILKGILMHHEREDGTGYPLAATGDKVNTYAKIVAIADVYDALTSERVYKNRITPFETFKIFEEIGIGNFDPKMMMTFLQNISCYYIGANVKLNTGKTGEVIFITPQSISLPVIRVEDKYIDLCNEKELKVVEML